MTALHRVKAYFGMVPTDELDAYDGYGAYDEDRRRESERRRYDDRYESERYESDRRAAARYDSARPDDADDRWRDRHDARSRYDDERAEARSRTPRPRDPEYDEPEVGATSLRAGSRGRGWAQNTGPNHTSVRGIGASGPSRSPLSAVGPPGGSSVAVASAVPAGAAGGDSAGSASPSGPSGSMSSSPSTRGALAVDSSRRREPVAEAAPEPAPAASAPSSAPAEITTLRPTSYNEARVIGENYRDGIPVIMNLTELDDVAAKRLVDFAAGLAFALRGSIEKVTNRVFLLSPPNVEVSAADRSKYAQGS